MTASQVGSALHLLYMYLGLYSCQVFVVSLLKLA